MAYAGGGSEVVAGAPGKDDPIKSSFLTREGTYKLMTLSEYSRPNRVPLTQAGNNMASAPVRVSFLRLQESATMTVGSASRQESPVGEAVSRSGVGPPRPQPGPPMSNAPLLEESETSMGECGEEEAGLAACPDRICFNVGRELYVYHYRGVRNAADLSKPIDKRVYKGTYPTCHDFNAETAESASCSLLIGFSAGQIQLIDPFRKDAALSRLFNEDRLIDKSRLTGLRWIPGSPKHFLAAHASGQLYVYHEDLPCGPGPPVYQVFKTGHGYTVYTCKTKSNRNPTFRWSIGEGPLHEFHFSPDAKLLATCSQDGFLRVFNYHSMELVGEMRSYFGGLLSLGWSPDGKYIVTGGEDDLVSVYSLAEKRVVCRGQGHRSWISQVAFDPYTTTSDPLPVDLGSEEDLRPPPPTSFPSSGGGRPGSSQVMRRGQKASVSSASLGCVCYRFGSVGQDTQLCLWDLTEDVLKKMPGSRQYHRASIIFPLSPASGAGETASKAEQTEGTAAAPTVPAPPAAPGKKHKRGFSFGARLGGGSEKREAKAAREAAARGEDGHRAESAIRVLGTAVCPRLDEVPLIEPLVCKKIAHERLTTLAFREDCIVTACQEGFICTWARPGKAGLSHQQSINSPNPGGSPNLLPGGTIV